MSILKISKDGWFISHETLVKEIYNKVDEASYEIKPELFNIITPYKQPRICKPKQEHNLEDEFEKEVRHVEALYHSLLFDIKEVFSESQVNVKNEIALNTATTIYNESGKNLITDIYGANPDGATFKAIGNTKFLFPENCRFFGKDVSNLSQHLCEQKYDLILLDPPWWNKYIRRKRKHTEHGYDMMFNKDLKDLPLENLINSDGLVIVWCTNSAQHLKALCDEIFPKWGVKYVGKWYWIKVTQSGIPVCQFSHPPRKQPFEQIILGCAKTRTLPNPPSDKLVVSVPSSLHSHKPPLLRLLEPYLPPKPECLELFARYLLPNWTSYGKEVLRLQHESLYKKVNE